MMWVFLLLLCFTDTLGCRSYEEVDKKKFPKYFTKGGWGAWVPTNNDWKEWIEVFGKKNSHVAFDSTEVGRDPESGWPRYWKGMGKGNEGVPPPPWAFVLENYGRPSFCYLQPAAGTCQNFSTRYAFNPTSNGCQHFKYNGCGGNPNNFMKKYDCERACGSVPDPGCVSGNIDFRDYIDID